MPIDPVTGEQLPYEGDLPPLPAGWNPGIVPVPSPAAAPVPDPADPYGFSSGGQVPPVPAQPPTVDAAPAAPPPQLSTAPPPGTYQSGISEGLTAYNEATHQRIATGKPARGRDAKLAAARRDADAEGDLLYRTGSEALGRQQGAQEEVGAAAAAQADARSAGYAELAQFHRARAVEEEKANAAVNSSLAQHRARYEQSVAEYRAMRNDPNAPIRELSGGQRLGLAAAAFAHGFLGAQGVKTEVMNNINNWMDRSLQAQRENIANAKDAAEGDRMLWDMARRDALDETDARNRVAGFLLEDTRSRIEQEVSKYDSRLARANAAVAMAQLDGLQAELLGKSLDHANQKYTQAAGQIIQQWSAEMQASIENRRLGLQERELAQRQDEAARKAAGDAKSDLVKRIVRGGSGRVVGYVEDEKQAQELSKKNAAVETMVGKFVTLRDALKDSGGVVDVAGARNLIASDQRYSAMWKDLVFSVALAANGGDARAMSDYDAKNWEKMIPLETLTTGILSGESATDSLYKMQAGNLVKANFAELNAAGVRALPEDLAAELAANPAFQPGEEGLRVLATQFAKPGATPVQKTQQRLDAPGATDRANRNTTPEWSEFTGSVEAQLKDLSPDARAAHPAAPLYERLRSEGRSPPGWARELSEAYQIATGGIITYKTPRGEVVEIGDNERQRARDLLAQEAHLAFDGQGNPLWDVTRPQDDNRVLFATHLLERANAQ